MIPPGIVQRILVPLLLLVWIPASALGGTKDWSAARKTAKALVQAGDFSAAAELYEVAFKEADQNFKGSDARLLNTAYEAAHVSHQVRRFELAVEVCQRSLARLKEAKGDEKLHKAALLSLLGESYVYLQEYEKAEQILKEGLAFVEEKPDRDDFFIPSFLQHLAGVYLNTENPQKALETLQKAEPLVGGPAASVYSGPRRGIGIQVQPNIWSTAGVYNMTGLVHASVTNHSEAEKWFRKALKDLERTHHKSAAELDPILKNIARSCLQQKKFSEAESLLKRAIQNASNKPGEQLSFVQAISMLGVVYAEQNRFEAVYSLMARTMAEHPGLIGHEAALLLTIVDPIAQANWAKAKELLDTIPLDTLGTNGTPWFLITRRVGSEIARKHDHAEAAEVYLMEWLQETERKGKGDISSSAVLQELVSFYKAQDKLEKAVNYQTQQVELMRTAFGAKDSRVANALEDLAALLELKGSSAEAATVRSEGNRIRAAMLGVPGA